MQRVCRPRRCGRRRTPARSHLDSAGLSRGGSWERRRDRGELEPGRHHEPGAPGPRPRTRACGALQDGGRDSLPRGPFHVPCCRELWVLQCFCSGCVRTTAVEQLRQAPGLLLTFLESLLGCHCLATASCEDTRHPGPDLS